MDASTGSLGQGISTAVGMALGAKLNGKGVRVYTLCGDGELQEGLVWEAAEAAAHYRLDNLTVLVDNNGLPDRWSEPGRNGCSGHRSKVRRLRL